MKWLKKKLAVMLIKKAIYNKFQEGEVENKKWYQSKTIVSGILTITLSVYQLVLVNIAPELGWNMPTIPEWLINALITVFGGVTVYGRSTANTKIK